MSAGGEEQFPIRACAWPRRIQRTDTVRQITPDELRAWITYEDDRLLAVNKPGDVVCHPSKAGPWSSLVGAVRELMRLERVHLIFRLDRETSGLVVLAKDAVLASRLQRALQERRVGKRYVAFLVGRLPGPVTVDQPLGPDDCSPVYIKTTVRPDGQPSRTHFEPLIRSEGFTLAHVRLESGRKHQIRAHARWLGYPVVGDKIYGPDDRCYLEFIDNGFTPALRERLILPRQALHCWEIALGVPELPAALRAPLASDLVQFASERMGVGPETLDELITRATTAGAE